MIANARMYSVNEATAAAWRTLLEWVIARAGVVCEVIDYPAPQPLPQLWARPDLGCAFMCGFPLSQAAPSPSLLAAPVPGAPSFGGEPVYWTDFVVRADSRFRQLTDTFGHRFAYTTEGSQSGYQAPRRLLAPHARARGGRLFSATVGPLQTPRRIVDAVLDGQADAGPLDSYVHELLRLTEPELAARLRVVAVTPTTAIPPLVAAPGGAPSDAARLREALYAIDQEAGLAPVRATLGLQRFAPISADRYRHLRDDALEADALGYPCLI